jgi:hypothetical protein
MSDTTLNNVYGLLASNDQIALTAKALEANGIHTIVVESGAEASQQL